MNAVTETKAAHSSIAAALAAAQAEMGNALKSANNPHFKSKYADLDSVMDACKPALNKHGIAVIQPPIDDESGRYVETRLIHSSGETLSCRVPLIVQKNDMQGYGSAVTYARRYGLMCMAGIAPEDDDGNAAAAAAPKREERQEQRPHPPQEQAKPAPRDPVQIADGIIAEIGKRGTHEALNALFANDTRASQAWDWLELEAPEHAKRVAAAKAERESALAIAAY